MSWDSPLSAVADLVAASGDAAHAHPDGAVTLDRLVVDLPVELKVRVGDDGAVQLLTAPPRQAVETTVMPVLHRMRVVVVADGAA